ncbi:MAG TPA: HAD family hydrolase [Streptosporangiaceae bacterium]|jgi:putative hydrolase of the HAD superfamily
MSSWQRPDRGAIEAVVFDAGGVLLVPDGEAGRAALRGMGHESAAGDWLRAYHVSNLAQENWPDNNWPAARRELAGALGVPGDQLDAAGPLVEAVISAPWRAADGAAAVLASLAAGGYQLAIVSNSTGVVEQQLEGCGICSVSGTGMTRVAIVVDSCVVGVEKPDPRIFSFALDALQVAPGRCVYVGDTVRFDVTGARAAGLFPVHLDPFGLCAGDGDHAHIAALDELTHWLVPGQPG